jgi:hypothetical protein
MGTIVDNTKAVVLVVPVLAVREDIAVVVS